MRGLIPPLAFTEPQFPDHGDVRSLAHDDAAFRPAQDRAAIDRNWMSQATPACRASEPPDPRNPSRLNPGTLDLQFRSSLKHRYYFGVPYYNLSYR